MLTQFLVFKLRIYLSIAGEFFYYSKERLRYMLKES